MGKHTEATKTERRHHSRADSMRCHGHSQSKGYVGCGRAFWQLAAKCITNSAVQPASPNLAVGILGRNSGDRLGLTGSSQHAHPTFAYGKPRRLIGRIDSPEPRNANSTDVILRSQMMD